MKFIVRGLGFVRYGLIQASVEFKPMVTGCYRVLELLGNDC